MPLYKMPDGNEYELRNDEVATQAYQAWKKQFGEQEGLKGLEAIEPSVPGVPNPSGLPTDPSILGHARGVAEGVGSTLWGIPAMLGGVISGLSEKVTNPDSDFEQNAAKWTQEYSKLIHPTTEEGAVVHGALGKFINDVGLGMIGVPAFRIPSVREVTPLIGRKSSVKQSQQVLDFLESQKSKEQVAPKDNLPPLEEAPLFVNKEDPWGHNKKEVETPLPELPENLLPLIDRYPNKEAGVDVGRVEGGDISSARETPLPKLPPEESGLLSIMDRFNKEEPLPRLSEEGKVDFPLRQEVLESPKISKAIDAFRQEDARLTEIVENAINKKVSEQAKVEREALRKEFASGMEQLGIKNAADAHGLNRSLYESGKGTQLPIEKTNRINKGTFGQSGALDPKVFLELFPRFRGTRVANEQGHPLPVYHGTTHRGKPQDTPISRFRTPPGTLTRDYGTDASGKKNTLPYPGSLGVWHSSTPEGTRAFHGLREGGTIYESFLDLKNPKVFESYPKFISWLEDNYMNKSPNYVRRDLLKQEYDGIQINNSTTDGGGFRTDYVSFFPKQIESTTGASKLGKSKFGQAGGWIPFAESKKKSPSFEEFAKTYSGYSRESLLEAYKHFFGESPKVSVPMEYNALTFTDKVIPVEEFISAVKGIEDVPNKKLFSRNLLSSSRIFKEHVDHPVFSEASNIVTKAIEGARQASRRVLDDLSTGLFPLIHKEVLFRNNTEFKEYFKWKYTNEKEGVDLPPHFSEGIRRFHEMELEASHALLRDMNAIRQLKGLKPVEALPNHMLHMWKGPYRFYLKKTLEDGTERIVTYIAEESSVNAKKASEYYKKNFPEYEQTPISFVESAERARGSFFDHLLDIAQTKDPVVLEALKDLTEKHESLSYKFLGQQHRFKNRQGKEGWVGNKPWLSEKENYKDTLDTLRYKYDAGYEWIAANKARMDLVKLQEGLGKEFPNAIALSEKYYRHAFGLDKGLDVFTKVLDKLEKEFPIVEKPRTGTRVTKQFFEKITIPWLLMYKYSHLVQSASQPALVIPRMLLLDQKLGGKSYHIPSAFAGGVLDGISFLGDFISGGKLRDVLNQHTKQDSLTSIIRNTIVEKDIGRIALIDDNPMFGEGGRTRVAANITADYFGSVPLSLFEGPSRAWAFGSFVRKFVADGLSKEEAIKRAQSQMDVMTNYNPEGASPIFSKMGPLGTESKGLHTFMINFYSQFVNYSKEAVSGIMKLEPAKAAPLLSFLAYTYAFAGLVGMIGVDLADFVLDKVLKPAARSLSNYNDTPFARGFTVRGWILDNFPDYLSVGPVAATTGEGSYGSFTSKVIDPSRSFLENIFPRTFASADILEGVATLPKAFISGTDIDKGNALEKALPKFATGAIRERFSEVKNEGKGNTVLGRNGFEKGLPLYTRTEKEQNIPWMGFGRKSLSEAKFMDQYYTQKKREVQVNEGSKAQMQKLQDLIIDGKPLGEQVRFMLNTWGIPDSQISAKITSVMEQRQLSDVALRNLENLSKRNPSLADIEKIKRYKALKEQRENAK